MDNLGGPGLKATIAGGSTNDETWNQLLELAGPLLQTIRGTFVAYTTAFDDQDCRGLLHDTFTQVILKIDQYDPSRPLLPWARSIARHLVIDALRDRTQQWKIADALRPSPAPLGSRTDERQDSAQPEEGSDAQGGGDCESPTRGAQENYLQYAYEYGEDSHLASLPKTKIFQQELSRLPDEDQGLIVEHWGNGIPLVDLARRAGISEVAMRKRAERVRKKLYGRLVRHPEFKDLELSRIKKSLPGDKSSRV